MLSRLTLCIFLVLYQIITGVVILVDSKPAVLTDSPRYFLNDDILHLLNEPWDHSGAYVQTTLFSLSGDPQAAINSNLLVWIICSTVTTFFVYRYTLNENSARISLIFTTIFFTSNAITGWIVAVLSESIGLSILLALIFPLVLDFLKLIRRSRTQQMYILSLFVFLAASKPLWAALIAPLIAINFLGAKKEKRLLPILAVILICISYVTFQSANRPYDKTGLTYSGWHSLMRAYAYSTNSGLGDAALGAVKECGPVLALLRVSQNEKSPGPLYYTFNEKSGVCPGLKQKLNDGLSNSPAKILSADLSKSRGLVVVAMADMAVPVVFPSKSALDNLFNTMLSSIIHTGAFLILPGVLVVTFRNRRLFLTILGLTTYSIAGAFVLYVQDGIDLQRHMLPMTVTFVVTSWISLLRVLQNNSATAHVFPLLSR